MPKEFSRKPRPIRFLADANIPQPVVEFLKKQGIDIISVRDIDPAMKNSEVAKLSKRLDRILITFDKDFLKTIMSLKIRIRGLIILRIGMGKKAHELAIFLQELIKYLSSLGIEGYAIIVSRKIRRVRL